MSNLQDIIKSRRSIRRFIDKDVNDNILKEIIFNASFAPSNNNRQGWKFYIIKNRDLIDDIYEAVNEELEKTANRSEVIDDVMKVYKNNFLIFKNAPVLIIACHTKPNKFNFKLFDVSEENSHFTGELISVSMMMQNIMLLCEEKEIGTLVMTAPLIAAKRIKEIVNIPKKLKIASFLCLGYHDEKGVVTKRKEVEKIIETRY